MGLSIQDNQGNALGFNRGNENEDWVFLDLESEADQEAINRVDSQLESISVDRRLDSDLDMVLTGLADPAFTIQLTVSNGGIFTLNVGEVTITGGSYYAQLAGQDPIVVSKFSLDSILNLMSSPPLLQTPTTTP